MQIGLCSNVDYTWISVPTYEECLMQCDQCLQGAFSDANGLCAVVNEEVECELDTQADDTVVWTKNQPDE